jgi:regulator of vacuolar morphogenesis
MTAIQAITVLTREEHSDPEPHVIYAINIQARICSWQMWRQYSEVVDLHTELTESIGFP